MSVFFLAELIALSCNSTFETTFFSFTCHSKHVSAIIKLLCAAMY